MLLPLPILSVKHVDNMLKFNLSHLFYFSPHCNQYLLAGFQRSCRGWAGVWNTQTRLKKILQHNCICVVHAHHASFCLQLFHLDSSITESSFKSCPNILHVPSTWSSEWPTQWLWKNNQCISCPWYQNECFERISAVHL